MIDVIYDFEERSKQIEKYLSFVWLMENYTSLTNLNEISEKIIIISDTQAIEMKNYLSENNDFVIESQLTRILKSNTILLLYNQIEGTVSSVLNDFFSTINKETDNYKKFNLPIKKIWLKYKHRSFSAGEKRYDDYILQAIENILEEVIDILPKTIKDSELGERIIYNYDAYSSETKANEVSGNLDARKIKEIFSLYGLPSIEVRCDSMLKVKNKRNSLAHGNETFVQVGSNFTIDDLFKMNIEITEFLKKLLSETDDFIKLKKYKIAVS